VPSLQLFVGAEFFCLNISWKSYLFLNMLELPDVEKIKRDEVMGVGVKIRHVLPLTLTVKKLRLAAGRWRY
jgi:hypothetical protein